MKKLTINECPHHGYMSIAIDDEDWGERITPTKCCGRWDTVKYWKLSKDDWMRLSDLAKKAAEEAED